MYKTYSIPRSSKLIGVLVSASLLFTGFQQGNTGTASAQEMFAASAADTINQTGIQPLDTDGGSLYYYADGQKISLEPSVDWVSVQFSSADQAEQSLVLGRAGLPLGALNEAQHITNPELLLISVREGVTVQDLVGGINSMRAMSDDFIAVNPVFKTANSEMAITDQFIATFSAEKSLKAIRIINASYGVEIVEPILGQENTYILRLTAGSHFDALAISNLYQENGIAISAAPNFLRMITTDPSQTNQVDKASAPNSLNIGPSADPNDFYYYDQWSLKNTQQYGPGMVFDADIDAPEAWDITTGDSSIIIAIVDEGVDFNHEDLSVVGGYDATGGGSGGFPSGNDAHGTNVAGLAAAVGNNSIGVSGVCQECRIMPVRIAYNNAFSNWVSYDSWVANGITWAYQNGASIINNSWYFNVPSTVITTAINNAQTLGRGGKGSVVVAAAGNFNTASVVYPANLPNVIAVGATNMCDERKTPTNNFCNGNEYWWGSSYGNELDISAPGLLLDSTDIMGNAGYSALGDFGGPNYYGFMNGTSGASPIVAGVAGLVLSVNPDLTAAEVQTILQDTADDVNGGGWDATMGYGRVNAFSAVSEAVVFTISGNVGISGVTLSYTDGIAKTATSLSDGSYSFTVSNDWSGTVVPSHACYDFTPTQNTYLNVTLNLPGENYTPALDIPAGCASINTYIGGSYLGTSGLTPGSGTRQSFTGVNNGPVQVNSSNSVSLIAAERVIYKVGGVNTSFSEMMALPSGLLNSTYWLPWYNNVDLDTQLRFGNVSGVPASVHVYIGGTEVAGSPFALTASGAGQSTRVSFAGVNGGPVQIVSDQQIVAAERVIYNVGGVGTSFSEMMAQPASQISTTYWLPWYNNVDLDTQLRIGNVSGAPASVHVYIGGTEMTGSPFALTATGAGQSTRISFAGVNAGPVQIVSDQPIVAAERVIYTVAGKATSFSEMMALPNGQVNTTYWLPWYNNVDLNTQLRIGNVSGAPASVHVYIGGVEMTGSPFALTASGAGQSTRVSFVGINNGPVQIVSDQNIVAAERVIYTVAGKATSFTEMMALPNSLLSTNYWLPWYNNVDLDTQLRFGTP